MTVVDVTILDLDDNPPVFTNKEIQIGMRRNVKQGSLLNLQLKVSDHSLYYYSTKKMKLCLGAMTTDLKHVRNI